jgi:hypothetical protein
VKPVQELLARRCPEKARRKYGLHNKRTENDPLVAPRYLNDWSDLPPSWQKIEDMIDSLVRFAPRREGARHFPPIEPMFWFDLIRVLGGQYQSQGEENAPSLRPGCDLSAVWDVGERVLRGDRPPSLDLSLLPEYVRRAVKRFCQATERDDHTCNYDLGPISEANVEIRTRYAAAYALLYSTDVVPLLRQDADRAPCDACDCIRVLYDCVDAISAGQIILSSKNINKVLGFIKRSAVSRFRIQISHKIIST